MAVGEDERRGRREDAGPEEGEAARRTERDDARVAERDDSRRAARGGGQEPRGPTGAEVRLRRATPEDLDALVELERLFPADRLGRGNFRRLLTRGNADIWVADQGGRLLGDAVVLYRRGLANARLYSLVVAPDARGRGLGGALLDRAEDAARQRGAVSIRLEVRRGNEAALALYRSRGYEQVGVTPDYYEDGEAALRLRKRLRNEPAHLLDVPFYRQTLDFTCGPAALLMAMSALGAPEPPDQGGELQLWREATTIYMLAGHGGCSAEGLAVAALRRGYDVTVYTRDEEVPFLDSVRLPDKKRVVALAHEQFMAQLGELGGRVVVRDFSAEDVVAELERGAVPLVLISNYRLEGRKEPHWVVFTGWDDAHLYFHDPYVAPGVPGPAGLRGAHLALERSQFKRVSAFGKARHRYMVAVSRPGVSPGRLPGTG